VSIGISADGFAIVPDAAGGIVANYIDAETPVDSGDHAHFTLAQAPNPATSLELFLEGDDYFSQFIFPSDYTLAGANFVLTGAFAPLTGAFTLLAYYRF
jgi:hypothetical protein